MALLEQEKTLFMADGWKTAQGNPADVVNPATETVLASVPSATAEDVENALQGAREAQAGLGADSQHRRGRAIYGRLPTS